MENFRGYFVTIMFSQIQCCTFTVLVYQTLSEAVGRALGSIISKFKQFKNVRYHTFTKLYDTGVNSILSYGARIWGFGKYKYGQQIKTGQQDISVCCTVLE